MAFKNIGPAVLVIGDPTTALGADMVAFDLEEAAINPGIRTAFAGDARTNGVPDVDSLYQHAPSPEFRLQLQDASKEAFEKFIYGTVRTAGQAGPPQLEDTLGFGDDLVQVAAASVVTAGIIPLTQIADGVDAADAYWLPGAFPTTLDGIQFTQLGEGDQRFPYNVTLIGVKRDTDQDGTAIPAGNRIIFRGPPTNLGLTWSVPADL